ncbi:hypothetical protein [Frankia casuarinae]|uniref:Uncharacterized protein n=1 Tax=Frankia casuarinae (strain DSM 45818 / CECT 9043 / HFP020203 / CcI3) TaxID=106370 RepID=Q2JE14_FRACC|nr:hypothetical protein [Frankia casuarinae]ABD10478.1 hypothetical protein Francci3_1097 [Frankia casuarinae]
MIDDWRPSPGSGAQPKPGSFSNEASGSAHVDMQAGVVHGDVYLYTMSPDAGPAERFESGVHHLDGGMADQARELMREAVVSPGRSKRMLFHWVLALVSGRSRDELSNEEFRWLRELHAESPEPDPDHWAQGLRVVILLLDAVWEANISVTVPLKELDNLPDPQQAMILRHLEQFIEGPLEDEMWDRALTQARNNQMADGRRERVWKFFTPVPIGPRARKPHPPDLPKGTRLRGKASAVFLAAWTAYVAVRLTSAGRILEPLGCIFVFAVGLVTLRRGLGWRLEYLQVSPDAVQHSGGFASEVRHDLDFYVAKYHPNGVTADDWMRQTEGTRHSISKEIIGLYRESRVDAGRVKWLLRHEAGEIRKLWKRQASLSYTREQRAVPGLSASGQGGMAILGGGILWILAAAFAADVLLAVETAFVVAVGSTVHVRARLDMEREPRRYEAEREQYEQVLAARAAGFERQRAKLADKPGDQEMARWLDCDRKLLLDRALRHYRLAASEVIAHAFLEKQAESSQRARIRLGPWRYQKYEISVFLLTADGVRNFLSVLDFETGTFTDQGRLNYRFDAIASFHLDRSAGNVQKFQLALMNGQKIQMKTTEAAPDELTEDETAASVANRTQDAGGLQHTIHILEGVAADGKNWIRRIESACYSRNSHIMQNSSGR